MLHEVPRAVFDPDHRMRIAFGLPNSDLRRELEWTTTEVGGHPWFSDVRPRNVQEQSERLKALVKLASGSVGNRAVTADILVLPELSTTRNLSDSMLMESIAICICLAGSFHENRNNIAQLRVGPTVRVEHRKVNRFESRDFGREHINAGDTLTLIRSGGWLICPLICKDLLTREIVDQLEVVGCNLIIVAALTDRLDPFDSVASLVGTHLQGLVLVANAALDPQVAPALLGLPLREQNLRVSRPPSQDRNGVWFVEFGEEYETPRWTFSRR